MNIRLLPADDWILFDPPQVLLVHFVYNLSIQNSNAITGLDVCLIFCLRALYCVKMEKNVRKIFFYNLKFKVNIFFFSISFFNKFQEIIENLLKRIHCKPTIPIFSHTVPSIKMSFSNSNLTSKMFFMTLQTEEDNTTCLAKVATSKTNYRLN